MPLSQALAQNPYARLMRLHQPVGIWLLMWPCWWSAALASPIWADAWLLIAFAAGAVVMRGAGCIVNDLWDRKIDAQVERTRGRPLASGELSVRQALGLLALLLLLALGIAYSLGWAVVMWSALALPLVAAYPLMKRITWWPQAFLGLTFNWGALLGCVAVLGAPNAGAWLLYAGGVCWTLGYDTIYAHQDKADDARIGVKSTALRLGAASPRWVAAFYALAALCWLAAGVWAELGSGFLLGIAVVALHFSYQLYFVQWNEPESCKKAFIANVRTGGLVFIALMLGRIG